MAEFPELGKSCALKACHKLDFTPFRCDFCTNYFCGEHRLEHDCQYKITANKPNTNCNSKSLKRFLCSKEKCFISEVVQIVCQHCGSSFCFKHRYPEEHQCSSKNVNNNNDRSRVVIQQVSEKGMERMIASNSASNVAETINLPLQKKEKVLNESEKRKADRIAVMRLKSSIRNSHIVGTEQMFLFVIQDRKRDPVMVSKHWTIGRCVDHIANQFEIPNKNGIFGEKKLRLYSEAEQSEPLPMGDKVEKHLKDLSNVFLKRDE